jgi:uncharacterized protein YcbX
VKLHSITRYPIKSLPGEALARATITERGVQGDRAYALLDRDHDRVVSAKDPRRYPGILSMTPDEAKQFGALVSEAPPGTLLRRLHTFIDADPDGVTEDVFAVLAPGTLFDAAPIHFITTSSLRAIDADARRFRPNLIIDTHDAEGFIENDWTGREVHIGDVVLRVVEPTPRCVVPSLAQQELPADVDVLKRLVARNRQSTSVGTLPCLGAYAIVVKTGDVSVGDAVVVTPRAEPPLA